MAKNFDQYDDNPVMKVLNAAKEEKQISNANEILSETSKIINSTQTKITEKKESLVETNKTSNTENQQEEITEQKKILMNISIRESTKKDWKMFFLEHDLSMTQGIETAVEFLKSEVEKGHIRLSKGGITQ